MAKVTVCFTLDSDDDRDLARWLDGLPSRGRSKAIREAIRAHIGGSGVTLGDVLRAMRDLERKVQTGAVVVRGEPTGGGAAEAWDEPPEAAAALDALASL